MTTGSSAGSIRPGGEMGDPPSGPCGRLRDDAGTMTILTTGILVVVLMVIAVGVAITGVQLQRNELQSMADGSALAASQAFTEAQVYAADAAPGQKPSIARADAERAASAYLRDYPSASTRLRDVRIASVEVDPDGTVHVVLAAGTDPPLLGWFTRRADLAITIHAAGDARAT